MDAIEVKGADLLSEQEKILANKILNEYYPRIQRMLKNLTSLRLYVKEYDKGGKRHKYSFNIEVVSATQKFEANASDWDFARTLHKVLNKAMSEIEHKLHSSDQHDKS